MARISVDLDDAPNDDQQPDVKKLRELAADLPSPHRAKTESLKRAERTQFAFSNVPVPIKRAFEEEAAKRGLTMKAFLYECLRAGGVDIPSNTEEIDARRR